MREEATALFASSFASSAGDAPPFGAEFEFILGDLRSERLLPPTGERLAMYLESLDGYVPMRDARSGAVIAVVAPDETVVSPDFSRGTIELSTAPVRSLRDLFAGFALHRDRMVAAAERLDLALLGVGYHPLVAPQPEFVFAANSRYRTDGLDYLQSTSQAIHVTMGVDAAGAIPLYRLFSMLTPVMLAMFANSSHASAGHGSGIACLRELMWTVAILDERRVGIGPDVGSLSEYFSRLAGLPFSRLQRDGQTYHTAESRTFGDYLAAGSVLVKDHAARRIRCPCSRADLASDIVSHESTTWFNVRLRHAISALEVRAADMLPPGRVFEPVVFCRGIAGAVPKVRELLAAVTWDALPAARRDAIFRGLDGDYFGATMRAVAVKLCDLAREGLECLREHDGIDHVDSLRDRIVNGVLPWDGPVSRDSVLAGCRFGMGAGAV